MIVFEIDGKKGTFDGRDRSWTFEGDRRDLEDMRNVTKRAPFGGPDAPDPEMGLFRYVMLAVFFDRAWRVLSAPEAPKPSEEAPPDRVY
jgi:hypothetical protein